MRPFRLILICFTVCSTLAGAHEARTNEPILPLPIDGAHGDVEKVQLGLQLFSEVKLSKNNSVACASCHDLSRGGVDGKVNSIGLNGASGDINAPTVFNSGLNFRQFWNGRAKTLEEQIDGPIQHPKEMGADWNEVVEKLKKDIHYSELFKRSYPDGVTKGNIKDAIATFERALITPNSRFDLYLKGDDEVITAQEKKGYQHFKSYGCIACHQGVNIGGNMFQTMGVMNRYFETRGTPVTEADLGRYAVTKEEQDKHVFRVPSLRNVALTAPYFHDGSAKTLQEAVGVMGKYQLGRKISKSEMEAIVAFLKTLTGEMPSVLKTGDRKAASK